MYQFVLGVFILGLMCNRNLRVVLEAEGLLDKLKINVGS